AVEGVEKVIHIGISRLLVPLVDELPLWERLSTGTKAFGTARPSLESLLRDCLDSGDPVRQIGACVLLAEMGEAHRWTEPLRQLAREAPPAVAFQARVSHRGREAGEPMLTTLDKVIYLRKVDLFKDLDVRALTAIATIAEERSVEPGAFLCRQGEEGESMFFIVSGTIQVLRDVPDGTAVELAEVGPPEYLGEMALFEDRPRTASLCARQQTTFLEISGVAFREIMNEYPQVGAGASRTLSQRLRGVLEREDRLRAAGTFSERRVHPRIATDLIATREEDRPARLLNISRGGAYLVEEEPSTPGQRVSLAVELPDRGPLRLEGTVLRSERASEGEGYGTAVVFEEVSEEVAHALDRWVEASQTGGL
ncbi:MAG: cyclic nucleotide-binding domain-containing protein, partial [Nitrospinota bacterium]